MEGDGVWRAGRLRLVEQFTDHIDTGHVGVITTRQTVETRLSPEGLWA
jgi:hypothetical protein